jgi:protein gp37
VSRIEWTGETVNPIAGCSAVSAGCTNCYARRMAWRLVRQDKYRGLTRRSGGRIVWTGQTSFNPDALRRAVRQRTPKLMFVNSMSDWGHPKVLPEQLDELFAMMGAAPHHSFQLLTKRPERFVELGSRLTWHPNIWLGVSVEDASQHARIDLLRRIPAQIRFLSIEPLIGPVAKGLDLTGVHWVIYGGESGPRARPMELRWAREVRDLCVETGTPQFFKQWGAHGADGVRRSRAANGNHLDGRQWLEFAY